MPNKKIYKCPRCGSLKVRLEKGVLICEVCNLRQDLIDFPVSKTWEEYYKEKHE